MRGIKCHVAARRGDGGPRVENVFNGKGHAKIRDFRERVSCVGYSDY